MKASINALKAELILDAAVRAVLTTAGQGATAQQIKDTGLAVVAALVAVDLEIQKALVVES